MKIAAGLGSIDYYPDYVRAGADEVFLGYVPFEWNKKYGNVLPLNRREVLYYNIQICSLEEMKILWAMYEKYHVPVTITFNSLYYLREQYEIIKDYIVSLMDIGYMDFIIADTAFILYLREQGIKCRIQLSGESFEFNSLSINFLKDMEISRYIFHRKNSVNDMKKCILASENKNCTYEAFVMNEKCHFTGAYCNSLHCDELEHMCKIPYFLAPVNEKIKPPEINEPDYDEDMYTYPAYTGCGLCALKELHNAGITHLKVVGRGNYLENMLKDIKALKKAINLIKCDDYIKNMKEEVFADSNGRCSHNCYYITENYKEFC